MAVGKGLDSGGEWRLRQPVEPRSKELKLKAVVRAWLAGTPKDGGGGGGVPPLPQVKAPKGLWEGGKGGGRGGGGSAWLTERPSRRASAWAGVGRACARPPTPLW